MLVYLRDGICSDECTCCHAEIEVVGPNFAISPSHGILTLGQPVPAGTRQALSRVVTGVPIFKSLVRLDSANSPQGKRESQPGAMVQPQTVGSVLLCPQLDVSMASCAPWSDIPPRWPRGKVTASRAADLGPVSWRPTTVK